MLPLPYNIDIDSLREQKVTEVCYSTGAVTLFFGNKAHIIINGYFALRYLKQRHEYYKLSPSNGDYGLLHLLDKEVTEVYLNAGRDGLAIEFSDSSRLELMGHKVEDTYTIHIKDREAVV